MLSSLSDDEKSFICEGVSENIRTDGRERLDIRNFTIKFDILPYCSSSCRLILHGTEIICGIKIEMRQVINDNSNDNDNNINISADYGKIKCNIRCSPSSYPNKKIYDLESINFKLSNEFESLLNSTNNGINFNLLCIYKNGLYFNIFIDCLILLDNGNIFDTIFLSILSSLSYLKIPYVEIKNLPDINKLKDESSKDDKKMDDEEININLINFGDYIINEYSSKSKYFLDINNLPIIITFGIINEKYFIADPLLIEEYCCDLLIRIIVFSNNNISILKSGSSGINPLCIFNIINNSNNVSKIWKKILFDYCHNFRKQIDSKDNIIHGINNLTLKIDDHDEKINDNNNQIN